MTHIAVFDHALHQAHEWVAAVNADLRLPQDRSAYAALRAVLHQLRDRLGVNEASDLAAQLPTLIRGVYYEGWNPAKVPARVRSSDAFIDGVRDRLKGHDEINPETAVRAVFALLAARVTGGEIGDVISTMPEDMRKLWPHEAVTGIAALKGG